METYINEIFLENLLCSYRTYEEWKRGTILVVLGSVSRSYRTYEEWKPCPRSGANSKGYRFLPYLWGMETELRKRGG